MKILLSNVAAVLTLCLASPSYASDNLNSITQEFDAVTLSTNTVQAPGANFSDFPDEIGLNICRYLSVDDLRRVSQVDHKYNMITNDNSLPLTWAKRVQELNPLNPPTYNISDVHANIIKSVLTNKLKFTNYGYIAHKVYGIQDNGELIMRADLDRLGIKQHQGIAVTYDGRENCTGYFSEDGKTHVGSINDENNQTQSFIVTNVNTKTIELLRRPSNIYGSQPYAISSNGKTIVGRADCKKDLQYAMTNGFRWTDQTGMVMLQNSKGPLLSNAICTDKNGQLIGGYSFSILGGNKQVALWIDNNHYLVHELLNLSSNAISNGLCLENISHVSSNGKALYGLGRNSAGKHIEWSLVFGDDSTDNIQQ